jgi:3-oxoacyl-[acyl-carrier protein] reductase
VIALDLSGSTALVTGASGGLGCAIAQRFAEAGAKVVIHYRTNREQAQAVASRLNAATEVSLVSADLTNEFEVMRMFDDAALAEGLDVLVNNAGVYPTAALGDLSAEQWDAVLDANLRAPFLCLRAAAHVMARRGGGCVINIASLSAHRPALDQSHYNSSKAALVALTRSAAAELGPSGIRVNAVSPGLVDRPGLDASWPEGVRSWLSRAPLRRTGSPADIADACVFLASPLAGWITGHDLVVDGGMSSAPAY